MRFCSKIAAATAACFVALVAAAPTKAADITLLTTGSVEFIMRDLIPAFEQATGHKVTMHVLGTVGAVSKANEGAGDLILLGPETLTSLEKSGHIVPGSIVNVFHSRAGAAVRAGAPQPDISTVEAFKQALLNAKTIGHSVGPSGNHFAKTVLTRLGIADQVKPKLKVIKGSPVGLAIAKGEVELGIHQVAELMPIKGIDVLGALPDEIQTTVIYATGILAKAKQPDAARALARYLMLETSVPAIKKNGMEQAPR
jgi:molybdate transport system substrate-binding protein